MVGIALTDISELKRAEEELRQTNAEQEAFTYSISHDLRAPLITITNYSEFLVSEHGASLDPMAVDVLGRIQRAAQRMDAVLQNLLLYSRVGRAQIVISEVDLGSVVEEVLIQHHGLIHEAGAQVEISSSFPKVRASRDLLGQVFSNLLTNALKYVARGKRPEVWISSVVVGPEVVTTVADNGIGIAPVDHERIFHMFERLHGQSDYPGTGIGLAVVQRAVERMKGRIWVESESGRGSRFKVALPSIQS
jgi:light-regulated signal transduction histidine kinase (bacteriophytochrome)